MTIVTFTTLDVKEPQKRATETAVLTEVPKDKEAFVRQWLRLEDSEDVVFYQDNDLGGYIEDNYFFRFEIHEQAVNPNDLEPWL
jgi:hypothetical protein